ncbi:phage tail terminator family protein [Anaerocolumna jejuensis]|uniref:phage tail terminator family protein n=1 Tax=Anaerocolumna jejuensis TaxID=259063 RepID=UPI003F7C6FD5
MVNNIIDGIVIKLDSVFGADSVIHTEGVEQDFKEPCFYVKLLSANQKQILNNRYYLQHSFDIHYFPDTANKNSEMFETASKLSALEYIISGGNLIRGTKMNYQTVDGVLHYFVDYNYYAYLSKEEAEKMQILSVHNGIGG